MEHRRDARPTFDEIPQDSDESPVRRALTKTSASVTTRTRGVHFLVDQVKEALLIASRGASLDGANGVVQHSATGSLADEAGKVALLPAEAREEGANRTIRLFGNGEVPSSHGVVLRVMSAWALMRPSWRILAGAVIFPRVPAERYLAPLPGLIKRLPVIRAAAVRMESRTRRAWRATAWIQAPPSGLPIMAGLSPGAGAASPPMCYSGNGHRRRFAMDEQRTHELVERASESMMHRLPP